MPLVEFVSDALAAANPDVRCLKWNGKPVKCSCGNVFYTMKADGNGADFTCLACKRRFYKEESGNLVTLMPARNDWRTPGGSVMVPEENGLFTTLNEEFGFNVDVAANAANTKCPLYFDGLTPEADALRIDWFGESLLRRMDKLRVSRPHPYYAGLNARAESPGVRAFGNCPYKPRGTIDKWLEKALEQAARGVFSAWLIPMSSSVGWFNDLVVPFAEWQTFKGRIPFGDPLASADEDDDDEGRNSPKQDNLFVIYNPRSTVIGHTAVREAKTGRVIWKRP